MSLTQHMAESLIRGAQRRAEELGIRVTAAVVDSGGLLKALSRMDGSPPLSAQIAEAKAVGAALWHRSGDQLASVHKDRPAFFEAVDSMVRVPMIPGLGSVLIRQGDEVVGAVGVSGGQPEQDLDCAQSGLSAIGSG